MFENRRVKQARLNTMLCVNIITESSCISLIEKLIQMDGMKKVRKKTKIDLLRDGAGTFNLNTPEDESEISEMFSVDDRLLIIKGEGVYEIKLADQIDPERQNASTPNTIQKIIPFGSNYPWVGRILLTAHRLFKNDFLQDHINCDEMMCHIVNIIEDISALYELVNKYNEEEKGTIVNHDLRIKEDRTFILPTISNVEVRCNEYLQKYDHSLSELFTIVKKCYPDMNKGGWDSLQKKIESEPKDIDNFLDFLTGALPLLHMIRNARNCVEHPKDHQRLVVTNFSLDSKNNLLPPMMKVVHPKTATENVPVLNFFNENFRNIIKVIELMLVFLCSRNMKIVSGIPIKIILLPEDVQESRNVRYGYAINIDGQDVPIS